MRLGTHVLTGVRILYGLFFTGTGCFIAVSVTMGWPGPRQPTPVAQAFTDALDSSGIINPLLAATYIIGGIALALDRTAPLGIVMLAPAIGTIFFFHLALSGQVVWGSANLLCFAVLAWRYRSRLSTLWTNAASSAQAAG